MHMFECEGAEVREDVRKGERACILCVCMISSQAQGESSRQGGEWMQRAAGCPR